MLFAEENARLTSRRGGLRRRHIGAESLQGWLDAYNVEHGLFSRVEGGGDATLANVHTQRHLLGVHTFQPEFWRWRSIQASIKNR